MRRSGSVDGLAMRRSRCTLCSSNRVACRGLASWRRLRGLRQAPGNSRRAGIRSGRGRRMVRCEQVARKRLRARRGRANRPRDRGGSERDARRRPDRSGSEANGGGERAVLVLALGGGRGGRRLLVRSRGLAAVVSGVRCFSFEVNQLTVDASPVRDDGAVQRTRDGSEQEQQQQESCATSARAGVLPAAWRSHGEERGYQRSEKPVNRPPAPLAPYAFDPQELDLEVEHRAR